MLATDTATQPTSGCSEGTKLCVTLAQCFQQPNTTDLFYLSFYFIFSACCMSVLLFARSTCKIMPCDRPSLYAHFYITKT